MDKPLPPTSPSPAHLNPHERQDSRSTSPRMSTQALPDPQRSSTIDRKPIGAASQNFSLPARYKNAVANEHAVNGNSKVSMTPNSDSQSIASRDLETPEPGHYQNSTYTMPPTHNIAHQGHLRDPSGSIAPSEVAEISTTSTPAPSHLAYEVQQEDQANGQQVSQEAPEEMYPQLQYHHAPPPRIRSEVQHTGSPVPEINLPVEDFTRPRSTLTVGSGGSDERHRSRLSVAGSISPGGSPAQNGRNLSKGRYSPDNRPLSYVDLLSMPYAQQVAPGANLDNSSLKNAIGSNASLLDHNKTLEMYRQNVKKTTDPAVQYEFAVFMVQIAMDLPDEKGPNSKEDMLKESRQILHKLADRGYPFAQYYLGDGFSSGLFNKGKEDYDRAFPLFVAASKHGHAEAGYRAALCYEFGWGCRKDYAKAVQFYRASASKNHPGAATRLGMACLEGTMGLTNHYREGIKWLKRAAESADFQYNAAPYELGRLHENGYGDDIFKDEVYAAQLFTQSADLGHPEANLVMGKAYEHGMLKCPKDAALSIHFYNGAAQAGVPEAMMALCAWYLFGAEPILAKDENEAFEWAKRSADLGTPIPTILNFSRLTSIQATRKQNTLSATSRRLASAAGRTLSKQMCGTFVQHSKAKNAPSSD